MRTAVALPVLAIAALLSVGTGCAAATRRPDDPPGLENFSVVDAGLWRCAQPTAAGLREAKRLGARTLVSIRATNVDARALPGTGLRYVRIPTRAWYVTEDDLAAFLRVATDPEARPVLVHCKHGRDRTGVAIAAYRIVVQGWTKDAALREMKEFGADPLWRNLRRTILDLDPERLRARMREVPAPEAVRY